MLGLRDILFQRIFKKKCSPNLWLDLDYLIFNVHQACGLSVGFIRTSHFCPFTCMRHEKTLLSVSIQY